MIIEHDEIVKVFKKVHAVRAHMKLYHVDGQAHRLSVDTLKDSVADMYGLSIQMFEVFARGDLVGGNVERYSDGRAVILVKAQQTEPMKRFVAVKELAHLMIDEQDDWSAVGAQTIKEMKVEFDLAKHNGEGVINPSRTQQSELLAFLVAIALTYPCEFHAADRAKIEAGEVTMVKLGLDHDVPPYTIEEAFNHSDVFATYAAAADS